VYLHRGKKIAINQEVLTDEVMSQLGVKRDELEEVKTVEVGNIFDFGAKSPNTWTLFTKNEEGSSSNPYTWAHTV